MGSSGTTLEEMFWDRWSKEYIELLREKQRMKRLGGQSARTEPVVGAIVLCVDENIPRFRWREARIMDLILGSDGAVRAAKVKMENGNVVARAIHKLIPLEISDSREEIGERDTIIQGKDQMGDNVRLRAEFPRKVKKEISYEGMEN